MNKAYITLLLLASSATVSAQSVSGGAGQGEVTDSIQKSHTLQDVTVKARNRGKSRFRLTNTEVIGQGELVRAACCNLGESFTTNPSVDVSYSDAATGARQIKLLGLSGTYVQMLTENMPNLRGASIPYSLGYVPGPWLQSIQVSKGASSVKNGYESITGQINIEYLKPQGTDGIRANAYLDSDLKQEVNIDGSKHLTDRLSSSLLLHFENRQTDHDGNGDGFMDMPKLRQFNGMWRMAYVSPVWISQFSFKALRDERESGMSHHHTDESKIPHYGIFVNTNRFELQWKNGFTLNHEHNTSLALMLNGSIHNAKNTFGNTQYDVNQKNGYAQLMFETDLTPDHNISVGASINHDAYTEHLLCNALHNTTLANTPPLLEGAGGEAWPRETTSGIYAQYTYKLGEKLTVMPGIRWDYSSQYGGFFTPRLHLRYVPWEHLTLRASAGKGYRTPHAIAENVSLLASGKTFIATEQLRQEEAWNTGLSASLNIPVAGKDLEVNVDYYYTDFRNQMVITPDEAKNSTSTDVSGSAFFPSTKAPTGEGGGRGFGGAFYISNLHGKSYSHTIQVDATYPFFSGFTATGAFRYTDSRTTYDGVLRHRPLTSRYKALLTLGYKTPLELWHFDITGSLNGPCELYGRTVSSPKGGGREGVPAYFQLQAQVTREFRHFSIYLGGENLTNYTIKDPIRSASNPWSSSFDATQVWGPTTGAMAYIGIRLKIESPNN